MLPSPYPRPPAKLLASMRGDGCLTATCSTTETGPGVPGVHGSGMEKPVVQGPFAPQTYSGSVCSLRTVSDTGQALGLHLVQTYDWDVSLLGWL